MHCIDYRIGRIRKNKSHSSSSSFVISPPYNIRFAHDYRDVELKINYRLSKAATQRNTTRPDLGAILPREMYLVCFRGAPSPDGGVFGAQLARRMCSVARATVGGSQFGRQLVARARSPTALAASVRFRPGPRARARRLARALAPGPRAARPASTCPRARRRPARGPRRSLDADNSASGRILAPERGPGLAPTRSHVAPGGAHQPLANSAGARAPSPVGAHFSLAHRRSPLPRLAKRRTHTGRSASPDTRGPARRPAPSCDHQLAILAAELCKVRPPIGEPLRLSGPTSPFAGRAPSSHPPAPAQQLPGRRYPLDQIRTLPRRHQTGGWRRASSGPDDTQANNSTNNSLARVRNLTGRLSCERSPGKLLQIIIH